MTKKVTWRQADLSRLLKGMMKAGLDPSEIHIGNDGKISVWVRGYGPNEDR